MRRIAALSLVLAAVGVLVVPFHPEAFALDALNGLTPATALQRHVNWVVVESGGNLGMFAALGIALVVLLRQPIVAAAIGIGIGIGIYL